MVGLVLRFLVVLGFAMTLGGLYGFVKGPSTPYPSDPQYGAFYILVFLSLAIGLAVLACARSFSRTLFRRRQREAVLVVVGRFKSSDLSEVERAEVMAALRTGEVQQSSHAHEQPRKLWCQYGDRLFRTSMALVLFYACAKCVPEIFGESGQFSPLHVLVCLVLVFVASGLITPDDLSTIARFFKQLTRGVKADD